MESSRNTSDSGFAGLNAAIAAAAAAKARQNALEKDFGSRPYECMPGPQKACFGGTEESYAEELRRKKGERKAESAAKRRQQAALKKAREQRGYLLAAIKEPDSSLEDLFLQAAGIIGAVTDDDLFVAEVASALDVRKKMWMQAEEGEVPFKS